MSKSGNGMDKPEDGQTALELEGETTAQATEQEAAENTEEPAEPAEVAANPVMELGNDRESCWKVLADGERVDISDSEWRKELTRLLAPTPPQAS